MTDVAALYTLFAYRCLAMRGTTYVKTLYLYESWAFAGAAQNFAVDDFNRHLSTTFANANGVALIADVHLRQERPGLLFGLVAE